MGLARVEHEQVEITMDITGSGIYTWVAWSVKTENCNITGTADSFNKALRMMRRRLRRLRRLARNIIDNG